jgi:hypothetical protein
MKLEENFDKKDEDVLSQQKTNKKNIEHARRAEDLV